MKITPAFVCEYLAHNRISTWAVAQRMGVDSTHLRRVLAGERPGSQSLFKRVLEIAKSIPRRPHRRSHDVDRLFEAAAHIFFLKRGDFQSAIFDDPDEVGLYQPARRKGRLTLASNKTAHARGEAAQ